MVKRPNHSAIPALTGVYSSIKYPRFYKNIVYIRNTRLRFDKIISTNFTVGAKYKLSIRNLTKMINPGIFR